MTELFSLTPGSGDPVKEVRHLGVDTGESGKSAALTPGDDSVLDGGFTSAGEEGTARVTLARVDATVGGVTSAHHGRIDGWGCGGTSVSKIAISIGNNWDVNTAKDVRNASAGAGGSPSGAGDNGSSGRIQFRSRGWQRNSLGRGNAEVQWSVQENQGNVILVGGAVVSGVSGNTGDQTVLFEAALNGKAVLTGDDAIVGDVGSVNAVGSIKDGAFVEDGSTARLRVETGEAFALEGNLEGKRVGLNFSSTDDLVGRDQLEFSLGDD